KLMIVCIYTERRQGRQEGKDLVKVGRRCNTLARLARCRPADCAGDHVPEIVQTGLARLARCRPADCAGDHVPEIVQTGLARLARCRPADCPGVLMPSVERS